MKILLKKSAIGNAYKLNGINNIVKFPEGIADSSFIFSMQNFLLGKDAYRFFWNPSMHSSSMCIQAKISGSQSD